MAGRAFRQHGPPFVCGGSRDRRPGRCYGGSGANRSTRWTRRAACRSPPRFAVCWRRATRTGPSGPEPDLRADLRRPGRQMSRGLHLEGDRADRREGLAPADLLRGARGAGAAAQHPVGLCPGRRERPDGAAAAAAGDVRRRRRGALRRHGRPVPDLVARRLCRQDMAELDAWRAGLAEDADPFAQLDALDREARR